MYFNDIRPADKYNEISSRIGDAFVNEQDFMQSKMGEEYWVEYLSKHTNEHKKAKIEYKNKIYYFNITTSKIEYYNNPRYIIVFSDVTQDACYRKKLENLIITDQLTSIYNRRHFCRQIDVEIECAVRHRFPLSLIMFDIDHFKKVNDKYGHNTGDIVLKKCTSLVQKKLRKSDIFCRIGGEEFIIILPHTDINFAKVIGERIRKAVEVYSMPVVKKITISMGIVQYHNDEDKNSCFKRVDTALYKAKENGRNQVVAI